MKHAFRGILVLLLCPLCGCPPQGNPNQNGAGIPGTPVSHAQRKTVIDSISTTINGMSAAEPGPARDALVAMFSQNTAIEETGISDDGSVWARFTDNRLLIVAMNNPSLDDGSTPKRIVPDPSALPNPRMPIRTKATESNATAKLRQPTSSLDGFTSIPNSPDYFLFNGYSDDHATLNEINSHLSNIGFWLTGHGYVDQTIFGNNATIENLLTVKNAGIVYFFGHGGRGFLRASENPNSVTVPTPCLGTMTVRSDDGSTDDKYEQLLKTFQIGYLVTPSVFHNSIDDVIQWGPVAGSWYFITPSFIYENWTFKPGAWVYLDACSSANSDIRKACIDRGAGVILGWDLAVRAKDARETSEFLFSRLLGINDLAGAKYARAEPIPQRAFPLDDMLEDLDSHPRRTAADIPGINDTLLTSTSIYNLGVGFETGHGVANFSVETASNVGQPLLLPTIQQLFIDDQPSIVHEEPNILTVAGAWGVDEPIVLVGGEEAEIISNSGTSLVCRISGEAHGPVTVQIHDHISSPRMLTRWTGTAGSTVTDDESMRSEFLDLDVSFREDVQSFRSKPGETPQYRSADFEAIPVVSKVVTANVTGSDPCPDSATGPGYHWDTPSVGDLPVTKPFADDDVAHMYFGGGGTGITFSETGDIEGDFAYGVYKKEGVHETGQCTPPGVLVDRLADLILFGGVEFKIGPGNYNIDVDATETVGTAHYTYVVTLTAESTPSNDDPR